MANFAGGAAGLAAAQQVQEDAADLSLGEFAGDRCLSNAEVAIVLAATEQKKIQSGKELSTVFKKTLDYVNRFAQIKDPVRNRAAVETLRAELEAKMFVGINVDGAEETRKLENFEIAALCNLVPSAWEEATTLIPSLERFLEDEVAEILAIVAKAQMFL